MKAGKGIQTYYSEVLLSGEAFAAHAQETAQRYRVLPKRKIKPDFLKLGEIRKSLSQSYKEAHFHMEYRENNSLEWLLDNYYFLEETLEGLENELHKKYFYEMPTLIESHGERMPRICFLAAEIIKHREGGIAQEDIVGYINAYQQHEPLLMDELWALPSMLLYALNKLCAGVVRQCVEEQKLHEVARSAIEEIRKHPDQAKRVLQTHAEWLKEPSFVECFASRVMQLENGSQIVDMLDSMLEIKGKSVERMVEDEFRAQTHHQFMIKNTITSIRMIGSLRWSEIFEQLSMVEHCLMQDEVYAQMDAPSRNYYRHKIVHLARRLDASETVVARAAVNFCMAREGEQSHVGYYLMGDGVKELYALFDKKQPGRMRIRGYVLLIVLPSLLISAGMGVCAFFCAQHLLTRMLYALLGFAVSFPAAVYILQTILNRIITQWKKPAFIPKLELKEGIPAEAKTMISIPALVGSPQSIRDLAAQLEVFYLANKEENLCFCILGDLPGADAAHRKEDAPIADAAEKVFLSLNEKYGERFYYFQRKRKNTQDPKRFEGHERKRGAVMALNDLLINENIGDFEIILPAIPQHIRYVITLDEDTQLLRESAKKFIGAMLHPMNRPVLNEARTKVIKGYGVLQPRVVAGVENAVKTIFSKVFSGYKGIDRYAFVISDVYQDLFSEGTFMGKGIYDLHTFETVLKNRIPDNTVLSHDLLEGLHVRAGFVSDIETVDSFPQKYTGYSMRQHRWARGDWQLLPYLQKRVKLKNGEKGENVIHGLGKWKITDNLIRSLIPVSEFLLLFLAFTLFVPMQGAFIALAFVSFLLCSGIELIATFVAFCARTDLVSFLDMLSDIGGVFYRTFAHILFLPYEAYLMADAALRSLYRVYVSRRNMLQWATAASVDRYTKNELAKTLAALWPQVMLSALLACCILIWHFNVLACVLCLCWLIAPAVAFYISKPLQHKKEIDTQTKTYLSQIARRTWAYFEDFQDERDHYLIPDNYQEMPRRGLARRTSPTNMGLSFSASLSAYHFDFIGLGELIDRFFTQTQAMRKLDMWNEHFYNWYDTATLAPLRPLYVSAVDNGNLAIYLLMGIAGLNKALHEPVIPEKGRHGLTTTFSLMEKEHTKEYALLKKALKVCDERCCGKESVYCAALKRAVERCPSSRWGRRLHGMLLARQQAIAKLLPWWEWARLDHDQERYEAIFYPSLHTLAHESDALYAIAQKMFGESELKTFEEQLKSASAHAQELTSRLQNTVQDLQHMFDSMDFSLLYDQKRGLFHIGFDAENGVMSKSYYDLLATEARQTSFIAVAKGDVPQEHWFRLGRPLTVMNKHRMLLSWSGTMFEYLMPLIAMKDYAYTLLNETYRSVVYAQRQFGESKGIPWGVSESAFYSFDINLNYQYKAFGVSKTSLGNSAMREQVISPYSTMLALSQAPHAAVKNLRELQHREVLGEYGFYDAIDFAPARLPANRDSFVARTYMAHHQGMSLCAMDNFLHGGVLQELFHGIPIIKAAEILLKEQIPKRGILIRKHEYRQKEHDRYIELQSLRELDYKNGDFPKVQFLSNGRYSLMLTASGGGYAKFEDVMLSRYRNDISEDSYGIVNMVRKIDDGKVWACAYRPDFCEPEDYRVQFSLSKASFARRDGLIDTKMDICVSPEIDAQIRRIRLVNRSNAPVELDVLQYIEVCLCTQPADIAHRSFYGLFVETSSQDGVLYARLRKGGRERSCSMAVAVVVDGVQIGQHEYETERVKAVGRLNGTNMRIAKESSAVSSGVETPLDPVLCSKIRVQVEKHSQVTVSFVISAAYELDTALSIAKEFATNAAVERSFEMAWTHDQVEMRHLKAQPEDIGFFHDVAARLLYSTRERVYSTTLPTHRLWKFGISGTLPMLVLRISDLEHLQNVQRLIKCFEFFRMKGMQADLVILNEYGNDYYRPLRERLLESISLLSGPQTDGALGRIFLLEDSDIMPEERELLYASANILLNAKDIRLPEPKRQKGKLKKRKPAFYEPAALYKGELLFDNTFGGFDTRLGEYVIYLENGRTTPLPWCNVLANDGFGTLLSESGLGYTWGENSREYKITPWNNDVVNDLCGERVYLRDEMSGDVWSPVCGVLRTDAPYIIRHGRGYSVYEHGYSGIRQKMTVFVDEKRAVKCCLLELVNESGVDRKVSASYYCDFVLGAFSMETQKYLRVQKGDRGELVAYKAGEYGAFLAAAGKEASYTTDRAEFLGWGAHTLPAGLTQETLSGSEDSTDPCGVVQVQIDLGAGEADSIVFLLGCEQDRAGIIDEFGDVQNVKQALGRVQRKWEETVKIIDLQTPDESFNLIMPQLMYQTISSRFTGRTGFYQCGGAYGYRDQLQDCLALLYTDPQRVRAHILLCAQHQFEEGDVQHWWHPPQRGVRTRISDDLLFLPYITAAYLDITQDYGILEETRPYLSAPVLQLEEEERYDTPALTTYEETLYDHCVRAIEKTGYGERGLPLIGGGDWNDGFNKIGIGGRGESVWLGFFLYDVLKKWIPIAQKRGDSVYHEWSKRIEMLSEAVEQSWDGAWYRRAYFDDGTPVGSVESLECSIDIISQAWAVISQAGDAQRARQAYQSALKLVDEEAGIIKLMWPPFNSWEKNPGYIKGYIPGIRENGGQYTHAAIWMIWAAVLQKDNELASKLFNLVNPINHARTDMEALRYKAEPYVIAADVYSNPHHNGRGGWTWYTGSAAWMYYVGLEGIIGLKKRGAAYYIEPCLPRSWDEVKVTLRAGATVYHIRIHNEGGGHVRIYENGKQVPCLRPAQDGEGEVQVDVYCSQEMDSGV
ncbi:MAG: GH36-type glycosyl hydrolase domain-containing protein [Christensenellales bacterium]